MAQISIELVPRSTESIEAEVAEVCEHFPRVRTVNIPDLMRFELRSWQACALARARLPRAIPHLRAMDFDRDREFPLADYFRAHDFSELLIVTGDPPQDMSHPVYPTTVIELIGVVKRALPDVRIYAAFDPYRSGMRQELEYAEAKLEAGACGLFSQPFFDLRLMDVWSELLPCELYWGVSPVTRPRQRLWWETKNHAVFPADFEPTLEWNRRFARRGPRLGATSHDQNLYFMPIRAGLVDYLDGIL